jgi:hypothetical protein
MGKLLRLYLGKSGASSQDAFWVGASRLMDPYPRLSSEALYLDLSCKSGSTADDWADSGTDLRTAIKKRAHR